MQHLKLPLFSLLVTGLLFLGACDDDDPDDPVQTIAERIAISWRVQTATQDDGASGSAVGFPTDNFRITFVVDAGTPSTYNVTPGDVPAGATPNTGTANSGNWSISGNTPTGTITFTDAAGETTTATYTFAETDGTITLTLVWTASVNVDKTEPTYTYVLVQA